MRKIISSKLDTVRVRHAREEVSVPSEAQIAVLKSFLSARIQVIGTAKRLIRDRENFDPKGLVSYVFLSSEHHQSEQCWLEAANKILADKLELNRMMDSYPNG